MPGPAWTKKENRLLRKQVREGKLIEEINIEGRSLHAIRRKAARLRLIGNGIKRKPWTEEEKALLKRLVKSGKTSFEIARNYHEVDELLPLAKYSGNAIQKQMQRMGLGDKKRARRAKAAVRFNQEEKIAFLLYLRIHYSFMTPEELAEIWNKQCTTKVTKRRVIYYLVIMKCKLPQKVIISMPYSLEKRRRRAKAKARRNQLR